MITECITYRTVPFKYLHAVKGLQVFSVNCIDASTLTTSAMAIKIAAHIPGDHCLVQEVNDSTSDQYFADGQSVVLEADGSSTFYSNPPTNNG